MVNENVCWTRFLTAAELERDYNIEVCKPIAIRDIGEVKQGENYNIECVIVSTKQIIISDSNGIILADKYCPEEVFGLSYEEMRKYLWY